MCVPLSLSLSLSVCACVSVSILDCNTYFYNSGKIKSQ